MKSLPFSLMIGIVLILSTVSMAQEWECQNCPNRGLARFDLDVQVTEGEWQEMGHPANGYIELYYVAAGVFHSIFNDDPGSQCLRFYEGAINAQLSDGVDTLTIQEGGYHTNLPPSPGTLSSEYLLSGSVARGGGKKIVIRVLILVSATGETVAEVEQSFDLKQTGFNNGRLAGKQLIPVFGKIRDFERNKRDTDPMVVIGFDEGAKGEVAILPVKDKLKGLEKTDVNIKVTDCDGAAVPNMELQLTASDGSLDPQTITTDGNGEATLTYTAPCDPGQYAIHAKFQYYRPFDAPGQALQWTPAFETDKDVVVGPGNKFQLAYKHTLTQDYGGQFMLKSDGNGVVVCTINWEADPPEVKGNGMVVAIWTGNADQCIFSGRSNFKVTYEGKIVSGEGGVQWLELIKTGETDMGGKFTIDCAGTVQELPGSFPIPVQEDDRVLKFELKHGATNAYDVPGTDTHYSYTLDMGCK